MIHDVILSCLNLHTERLPLEEFVASDAISAFFHPCEKQILSDILQIINNLREVAKFAKYYGSNQMDPHWGGSQRLNNLENEDNLQCGIYLKAFANGIETVLQDYIVDIKELERRYIQNPSKSLMFIYRQLQEYEPLALYIKRLIRDIRVQKIHGCTIIKHLQQNSLHGDLRICKAIKIIQASVNVIFLKQLTHWILYAKIVDTYGEFFIQCADPQNNQTAGANSSSVGGTVVSSERAQSGNSIKQTNVSLSDTASSFADIWQYEIRSEMLPSCFSTAWAEKVLFIGQTVLMFLLDMKSKSNKSKQIWHRNESITSFSDSLCAPQSLWDGNELLYFAKIQALQKEEHLNVSHYERVIDEIKSYMTNRLSEIAFNHADLVNQLRLIKDFYLLGRGELYLEFIRRTHVVKRKGKSKDKDTEPDMRDFAKTFELAAHSLGISEDLERFSLHIPKLDAETEPCNEFGPQESLQLDYKVNWPLHLLISPRVLERYNTLFRFLLLIKRKQYGLHVMWCEQRSNFKRNPCNELDMQILHLRNQLMFFLDNLQYYIQVDVLESQFSILLNTILNKVDFEEIQRAHSVFQANILFLCFLLTDEDSSKMNTLQSNYSLIQSTNPVYLIINEICHICEDFCILLDSVQQTEKDITNDINTMDKRFGELVEQLINLLVGLKAAPSMTPLSQLLLRLDFNHWFSVKKHTQTFLNSQDSAE